MGTAGSARGGHAISRRVAARLAVSSMSGVLAVAALALVAAPVPAWAGAVEAQALITHPGTASPLDKGGSTTPFGVVIPTNASCPGDSAHHGYHVFSYLVPDAVSPATVNFKTGVPGKYLGYITDGSYFGAVNTAEGTGQIMGVPTAFSWTRWTSAQLLPHGASSATWDGGIACADSHGVVTNFWNSRFVITASASDPHGYAWRVVQTPPSSGHLGRWIGIGLIVLSIVLGSIALSARHSRRDRPPTTDEQPGDGVVPISPDDHAPRATQPDREQVPAEPELQAGR